MKNLFVVVMAIVCGAGTSLAQNGWVTTFGGSSRDEGLSVIATLDGGCVMTGSTESSDGDVAGVTRGSADAIVVRYDNRGSVVWKRILGGSQWDVGHAIALMEDDGYVLVGETQSTDGDFAGSPATSSGNIFVMLLNPQGEVQWKKIIGGKGYDIGYSVTVTPDHGIVLAGTTESNDADFDGFNKGGVSGFIMMLNQQGEVQWKTVLGGSGDDFISSISAAQDGGYVVTGWTQSNDGYFDGLIKGLEDIFVAKIDSQGNIKWVKTFGGTKSDVGYAITATLDGGCVATGYTQSDDADFAGLGKGDKDIVAIKLDPQGNLQWRKLLGGSLAEEGNSITIARDGGTLLAGYASSSDGDFDTMNSGGRDIVIFKLDNEGNTQWTKLHGGSRSDQAFSLCQSYDSGFVLTGSTQSSNGLFERMNKGSSDVSILKVDAEGNITSSTLVTERSSPSQSLAVSPNPAKSGATILYHVLEPSYLCIHIIDGLGNVVSTVFEGYADVGRYQNMMSTSSLAPGWYTVRVMNRAVALCTSFIVL